MRIRIKFDVLGMFVNDKLRVDRHQLADLERDLKTILHFYKHRIFIPDPGYNALSYFVQKSDLIANPQFHTCIPALT